MKVVGIHGIWNPVDGAEITRDWFPNLQYGLQQAGFPAISKNEFVVAAYADLFESNNVRSSGNDLSLEELNEPWTEEFLLRLWREAALQDRKVQSPDLEGRGRKADLIQEGIRQMMKYPVIQVPGEKISFFTFLSQVRRYLFDKDLKAQIQERVVSQITEETRVIIGHSLGSIVAYECLCKHPSWKIHTLVTVGSPLGITPSVFKQLIPTPQAEKGDYPPVVKWINVADERDIVALEKKLSSRFGEVEDYSVKHSDKALFSAHDVRCYLKAIETGRAIGLGLVQP
jgi:hypothetical protein